MISFLFTFFPAGFREPYSVYIHARSREAAETLFRARYNYDSSRGCGGVVAVDENGIVSATCCGIKILLTALSE